MSELVSDANQDEDPQVEENNQVLFKRAMQKMITNFCGGKKTRDHILAYLKSRFCKKPHDKTVNSHTMRINHLIKIANMCEGCSAPEGLAREIDETDFKKLILFETFPQRWKDNFRDSGHDVIDCEIQSIQDYFNIQKHKTDLYQVGNFYRRKTPQQIPRPWRLRKRTL